MDDREKTSGKKMPMAQALAQVINEYNKEVAVKKWRVDSNKKKLIYALLRCPVEIYELLSCHYDQHKHSQSGLFICRSSCTCDRFFLGRDCWALSWYVFCLADDTFKVSWTMIFVIAKRWLKHGKVAC